MKEITRSEIIKSYRQRNPILLRIFFCVFGLIFEIGMPSAVLILGIISKNMLVVFVVFPIVLGVGLLLFRGILYSTIRESLSIRTKYRVVRAKCIEQIHIEGTGDSIDEDYWVFKTDDKTIKIKEMGVPKGEYGYLIVVNGSVVDVFNAKNYYTNDYKTSFYSNKSAEQNKEIKTERRNETFARIFLEFLVVGVIAFDIAGCYYKHWVIALSGGLLLVFYLLGSLIGGVHAKVTGIFTIIYLFINGILFYYLSHTYNHSTAAYIVGTVFVLISVLSSIIWIKVEIKKKH